MGGCCAQGKRLVSDEPQMLLVMTDLPATSYLTAERRCVRLPRAAAGREGLNRRFAPGASDERTRAAVQPLWYCR